MRLNRVLLIIVIIFVSCLFFMFFYISSNGTEGLDNEYYEKAKKEYKIFNLKIPDNLYFAGEKVPINNFLVRERLEKELFAITYWHSRTSLILKRSARYFPVFKPILEEYVQRGIMLKFRLPVLCILL